MGRRGPKPAPTALAVAAGTRASRINGDAPAGQGGDPTPLGGIFFSPGFRGSLLTWNTQVILLSSFVIQCTIHINS